jgi:hypothetical protein
MWAKLYNLYQDAERVDSHLIRTYLRMAFFMYIGWLPRLMRSGIESYKTIFVGMVFIPIVIILFSTRKFRVKF